MLIMHNDDDKITEVVVKDGKLVEGTVLRDIGKEQKELKAEQEKRLHDVDKRVRRLRLAGKFSGFHYKLSDDGMDIILTGVSDNSLLSYSIPEGITVIGDACFALARETKAVELPKSIRKLGNRAFQGSGITYIPLPSGIEELGDGCFSYCKYLSGITLPESLKVLGDECFAGCPRIDGLRVPARVSSVGKACFSDMAGLQFMTFLAHIKKLPESCFNNCDGMHRLILSDSVVEFGEDCLLHCTVAQISLSADYYILCPYELPWGVFQKVHFRTVKRIEVDDRVGISLADGAVVYAETEENVEILRRAFPMAAVRLRRQRKWKGKAGKR